MDDMRTLSTSSLASMSFQNNMTYLTEDPKSTIDFDDEWQRILVAFILLITSLIGIFGNSLVILSVILSRKLRSPTNVFVVTLSVADLLTGLAIPWNVVALLSFEGWPIADWICSVAAVVLYVPTFCSVLTLASIGINRLVIITRPVHVYQKIFCTKVLCVWIAFLWIWPFVLTTVPPLVGFGALGYNERFHTCSSVSANPYSDQYDIIVAMIIYPIPLITIIGAYIWIFIHVRKVANKLSGQMTHAEDSVSMTPLTSPLTSPRSSPKTKRANIPPPLSITPSNNPPDNQRPKSAGPTRILADEKPEYDRTNSFPRSKREMDTSASAVAREVKKTGYRFSKRIKHTITAVTTLNRVSRRQLAITKNMFYVVVAYIICLTPFVFCLIIDSDTSSVLIPYASALIFFNSCINPIIYATKHPYFKKIFSHIMRCQWHKIPEPSDTLRALRQCRLCNSR